MADNKFDFDLYEKFANTLIIPVFIIDSASNILYYNKSAEKIIGFSFQEKGIISFKDWPTLLKLQDEKGNPVPFEKLPLYISYTQHRLSFSTFFLNIKGNKLKVDIFSLPVVDNEDNLLGTVVFIQPSETA